MNNQEGRDQSGDVTINWVEGDEGGKHNNYLFEPGANSRPSIAGLARQTQQPTAEPIVCDEGRMRDRMRSKINSKQTKISREKWMGFAIFVACLVWISFYSSNQY
jgi:hypothetical protein